MADGRIEFEITADGRKAFASIDQVTDALNKAGKSWEQDAGKSTNNIEGSFTGMVKKVVGAISAAKIGQMLLNIGKDAVQAASDLEEVQNVVDVTFGDAGAVKIEKWAKTAGDQFGLTETQAKKFTSTLGAMMKSAGMSGDEVLQMSTDLSGLAADMASFYNLDFDTAFQKIRSGISGETEPLKQLGINMSEVNLEAFAMAQGITKSFSSMSQGEKTMLRYQYLMQATADAQGDFARTSDGFANATRKVETNLETLKTNLGKTLLPVVNTVVGAINNLFSALTQEKKETVLDEFAAIDLKTEEKIAGIEATTEKARTLNEVLKGIDEQAAASGTALSTMDDNAPDGSTLDTLVGKLEDIETQAGDDKTAIKGIDDEPPDGGTLDGFVETLSGIETQAGDDQTAIKEIADDAPTGAALDSLDGKLVGIGTQAGNSQMAIQKLDLYAPDGTALNGLSSTLAGIESKASDDKTAIDAMDDDAPDGTKLDALDEKLTGVWTQASNNRTEIKNMTQYSPTGSALDGLVGKLGTIETKAGNDQTAIKGITDEAPDGTALNGLSEQITGISTQAGNARTAISTFDINAPDGNSGKLKTLKENVGAIESNAVAAKEAVGGIDEEASTASSAIATVTTEAATAEEAVAQVEKGASSAQDAVEELTTPTQRTAEQNALWLETCKQLVETIPGLSSIINTETGEIQGGTKAVEEYIDAWERGQKLSVMQSAHRQKQAALEAKFAELPVLELNKVVDEYRLKKNKETMAKLMEKYGMGEDIYSYGSLAGGTITELGITEEDAKTINDLLETYPKLREAVETTTEAYNTQKAAYDEAVIAIQEEGNAIVETYGNATEATNEWTDAQKEAAKTAVNAFEEALTAVEDYYNTVRKETASDVNGELKGFEKVKTVAETYKEAMKDADEAQKQLEELKEFFGEGIEINFETAGAHQQIKDMVEGLRSQVEFIEQYQKDLAAAREKGLSEEMLAYLSDGSEQSAAYLNAIANADSTQIEEINKLYEEVNKGKETFIDELTQQKLAVDEQYQGLVESAKQAAKDLDVSDETEKASKKNIHAIALGINQQLPEIKGQVDAVLRQLNRLAEWGVSIDLDFGGSMFISRRGNNTETIGEYETGLNWVPFDGFLASLHEGEAILTAEENRVWQKFRNGQQGVDYDTLGGVMRDNVRPGGDVYLNGRVVGEVISQVQGAQYRNMQRSGWQQ